ncbi:Hypothetical_protein [Hexamita inflata]|uniref:Hypothetical_protein n=1 Tax=Hexamita inflata TaxID=28002 RepID=A0AA86QQ57_9EUKA|nr:Hypothetical protein HINF_LOCUS46042 [Hexamita inflata]
MNSRTRLTDNQKTQLEQNFVVQLQQCYNVMVHGVKEAVTFFQDLSMSDKRQFDWHALDKSIEHHSYPTKSYSYKYINEAVAAKYADKWPQEVKNAAKLQAQKEMDELQYYLHARGIEMTPTDMRRQVIDTVYARVSQNPAVLQCPKKVLVDMLRHFLSEAAVNVVAVPTAVPVPELNEQIIEYQFFCQPEPYEMANTHEECQIVAAIDQELSSSSKFDVTFAIQFDE